MISMATCPYRVKVSAVQLKPWFKHRKYDRGEKLFLHIYKPTSIFLNKNTKSISTWPLYFFLFVSVIHLKKYLPSQQKYFQDIYCMLFFSSSCFFSRKKYLLNYCTFMILTKLSDLKCVNILNLFFLFYLQFKINAKSWLLPMPK